MSLVSLIIYFLVGASIPVGKNCPESRVETRKLNVVSISKAPGTNMFDVQIKASELSDELGKVLPDKGLILVSENKNTPFDLLLENHIIPQSVDILPFNIDLKKITVGQKVSLSSKKDGRYYVAVMGYKCDMRSRSLISYLKSGSSFEEFEPMPEKTRPKFEAVELSGQEFLGISSKFIFMKGYIPSQIFTSVTGEVMSYNDWVKLQSDNFQRLTLEFDGEKLVPWLFSCDACKTDEILKEIKRYPFPVSVNGGVELHWVSEGIKKEYSASFAYPEQNSYKSRNLPRFPLGTKGKVVSNASLERFVNYLALKLKSECPSLFVGKSDKDIFITAGYLSMSELATASNYADLYTILDGKNLSALSSLDELKTSLFSINEDVKSPALAREADEIQISIFSDVWTKLPVPIKVSNPEVRITIYRTILNSKIGYLADDNSIVEICSGLAECIVPQLGFQSISKNGLLVSQVASTSLDQISGLTLISEVGELSTKTKYALIQESAPLVRRQFNKTSYKFLAKIRETFPNTILSGKTGVYTIEKSHAFASVKSKTSDLAATIDQGKSQLNVASSHKTSNYKGEISASISKSGKLTYYFNPTVAVASKKALLLVGAGLATDDVVQKDDYSARDYLEYCYSKGEIPDYVSSFTDMQTRYPRFRDDFKIDATTSVSGTGISAWELTNLINTEGYDSVYYFGHGLEHPRKTAQPTVASYGAPLLGYIKGASGFSKVFMDGVAKEEPIRKKGNTVFMSLSCQPARVGESGADGTEWNFNQYISHNWGWEAVGVQQYLVSIRSVMNRRYKLKGLFESPSADRNETLPDRWQQGVTSDGTRCFLPNILLERKAQFKKYTSVASYSDFDLGEFFNSSCQIVRTSP